MVWHQGIHDKMGMQRLGMRREGVEGAPGPGLPVVPWRGKGTRRSGTPGPARAPAARRRAPVCSSLPRRGEYPDAGNLHLKNKSGTGFIFWCGRHGDAAGDGGWQSLQARHR